MTDHAAEVPQLRAENDRLRAALEPFAACVILDESGVRWIDSPDLVFGHWLSAWEAIHGSIPAPPSDSCQARYLAPDQVAEHRAAGWEVEPIKGHHGAAGYHLAVRKI